MHRHPLASALSTILLLALSCSLNAQERILHLVGSPTINRPFKLNLISPATSNGHLYYLLVSLHTDNTLQFPAATNIKGLFRLQLNFVIAGMGRLSGGVDSLALSVPNSPALVGATIDVQYGDADLTAGEVVLSDNEAVITGIRGIGTSVFAQGSASAQGGMTLKLVQNPSMGKPTTQLAGFKPQIIQFIDFPGYAQGYDPASTSRYANYLTDANILKADRVMFDGRDLTFPTVHLPNGLSFGLASFGTGSTPAFSPISIRHSDGKVSRLGTAGVVGTSTANPFVDYWGFSKDGAVAIGLVDFGSTYRGPDKVFLYRTDGSSWPGTSSPRNEITPLGATVFELNGVDAPMVANEVVFIKTAKGKLYWAPLDGTARLKELALPNLGTGKPVTQFLVRSFRVSRTGKELAFAAGASSVEHDVIAISNIDKTGNFVVKNITAFTLKTRMETDGWGAWRGPNIYFNAVLSRDVKRLAFITGLGSGTVPNQLYVVPMDGSMAGKLSPAGSLPVTHSWKASPQFLVTGEVLVFCAAKGTASFDLFKVSANLSSHTQLTTKGNLVVSWTMEDENGFFYYFGRAVPGPIFMPRTDYTHNIIGVGPGGSLIDITGSEFSGGTEPDIDVNVGEKYYINEFRMAPNKSGELYFIAGKPRKNSSYHDHNVYRFRPNQGTQAVRLTNNNGSSGSGSGVIVIKNLNVLSDGSFVYAFSTGSPSSARPQRIAYHSGKVGATPVVLSQFAQGSFVVDGSVRVVESIAGGSGGVYWVQADNNYGYSNARAYFVLLDNSMKGHPFLLSDRPGSGNSYTVTIMAGSLNP